MPHFVTQQPSDPGIQWPGDPVDPVILFYNELQMLTYDVIRLTRSKAAVWTADDVARLIEIL